MNSWETKNFSGSIFLWRNPYILTDRLNKVRTELSHIIDYTPCLYNVIKS